MRSRVAPQPPKDRRFLALNATWKGDGRGSWVQTGERWIEAWWDGQKYCVWSGRETSLPTETLALLEWAEVPECTYK